MNAYHISYLTVVVGICESQTETPTTADVQATKARQPLAMLEATARGYHLQLLSPVGAIVVDYLSYHFVVSLFTHPL